MSEPAQFITGGTRLFHSKMIADHRRCPRGRGNAFTLDRRCGPLGRSLYYKSSRTRVNAILTPTSICPGAADRTRAVNYDFIDYPLKSIILQEEEEGRSAAEILITI